MKGEFNFSEKQGRLVFEISAFLELDLDNAELEKVFNEMEVTIKHPLIVDTDIRPITN